MMADARPSRAELLKARGDLQEQLIALEHPAMWRDWNPQLAERLRAVIAEIDECVANMGNGDAQGS